MASSSAATELNIARKNLAEALGDSMSLYLQNLNAWFKKKKTKEEFDLEGRSLMRNDTVHLHNEFLLALMVKCHSFSSSLVPKEVGSSGKHKPCKVRKRPPGGRGNLQQRFIPAQTIDFVPQITSKALEEGASPTPLGFVSGEGLLPDAAMIHGRMLVCAWETGLSDVQDSAVKLLLLSLESQLKHVLSLVIQQRKGYKLRDKKFVYSCGVGVKNPYSLQALKFSDPSLGSEATTINRTSHDVPSLRSSVNIGEEVAAHQDALGWEVTDSDPEPISLFDVHDALHLHKGSVASHAVYAPTMERILLTAWHPGHNELAQDSIHSQEVCLKHKLAKRQNVDQELL